MAKKRDTVTYLLLDKGKVVYKGTTNDLEKTEQRHKNQGKRFTSIKPTSRKITEEGAKEKEAAQLEAYRKGHGGKNPKYNKDANG